jgi:uncharacterized membrane protein
MKGLMKTPTSIKAHPTHPMLVTIPIGLWIFSLAADIIYVGRLTSNPELWREIAFYTMAGGIAGALLAAIPGFIDLLSVTDPACGALGSRTWSSTSSLWHFTVLIGPCALPGPLNLSGRF